MTGDNYYCFNIIKKLNTATSIALFYTLKLSQNTI
jgi:hypothetical protein